VTQQKSKKTLINWDLVSVNPNDKNWDWKDLFCFWGVNIQSVIGFSLITSLYVIYNLNSYVVFFGTLFGSLLVYFFSNIIGKPSQKFGLPFVVLLRSSLGVVGAKYVGLIRFLVGVFFFGIQTYFLSKGFSYLIRILFFSIEPLFLDKEIFLIFFLGMNIIDWIAIIFTIFFQGFLFSNGMNFNKKIINFSALTVYIAMMVFFFSVLLSDVKFTSTAFINILDFENFLDKNNFVPFITVAGTTFAYFSIVILSYGDFSRYVKNDIELRKGNLSLILNLIIFSLFSLFIVSGVDAFLKDDTDNLSRILTNPSDMIGKLDNLLVTVLVIIFIIIASASTNLIANFIPSQYTLINFIPSSLSIKSTSFVIIILGFLTGIFWLTYLSQIGILSLVDTFGAFFGPLFGIMISDFYFIKKKVLNNKDIYSLDNNGIYYYTGGWHLKGIYSLIIGFIFSVSTIWNANLMFLQSFSWIIGALFAGIVYYLLAKE
jgi:NCS1 family nucleobase:cation symporter-1|tara:strand:+ start:347 stop:1804 length:1458 start_codon:yes stop_codon:yes gene_type:complete